jgi:uracil-DNA glycosylase family 4
MVKCHPMADPSDPEKRGNDRPPEPDELEACRSYLDEQVRIIGPRVIVALGAVAGKALCGTQRGITALRGHWHEYCGVPVLPTFHPAALLRNPELKRDVWTDMKDLKRALEEGA